MFTQRKAEVIAKIAALTQRANTLYGITLPAVALRFDLRGRVAGMAGHMNRRDWYMRFNTDMMQNESWDHLINDTVPHELAHIVCFVRGSDRGHGYEWKRTCRDLGGTGTRCHNEEVTYAKGRTYTYTTATGVSVVLSETRHRRVQKGQSYTFRTGGRVDRTCAYSLAGQPMRHPAPIAPPAVGFARAPVAGATNASKVRAQIAVARATGQDAESVVQWAVDNLGMKRQLARAYVKNNVAWL